MAITYNNVEMSVIDQSGNVNVIYPKTKASLVYDDNNVPVEKSISRISGHIVDKKINLYVSPSGLDTNPGTIDKPFKTIQKAVDMCPSVIEKSSDKDNDASWQSNIPFIIVKTGTYNECINITNKEITILIDGNVTIASSVNQNIFCIRRSSVFIRKYSDGISNLEFIGSNYGIRVTDFSHLTINNINRITVKNQNITPFYVENSSLLNIHSDVKLLDITSISTGSTYVLYANNCSNVLFSPGKFIINNNFSYGFISHNASNVMILPYEQCIIPNKVNVPFDIRFLSNLTYNRNTLVINSPSEYTVENGSSLGLGENYVYDESNLYIGKRYAKKIFYVDPVTGTDTNNDGLSPDKPLRSIQKAIDLCPSIFLEVKNDIPNIYLNGGIYYESICIRNKNINFYLLGDVTIDSGSARDGGISTDYSNVIFSGTNENDQTLTIKNSINQGISSNHNSAITIKSLKTFQTINCKYNWIYAYNSSSLTIESGVENVLFNSLLSVDEAEKGYFNGVASMTGSTVILDAMSSIITGNISHAVYSAYCSLLHIRNLTIPDTARAGLCVESGGTISYNTVTNNSPNQTHTKLGGQIIH